MIQIFAAWSIALLLGGMTMFSAVVAPLVFTRLPAEQAGRFIRAVFPWYYLYVLVCSGLAAIWLGLAANREVLAWLMCAVFASGLYARQRLMPGINSLRDAAVGGDADAGRRFQRLHALSVWLNGLQWLAALVTCALLAGSPAGAEAAPALAPTPAVGERQPFVAGDDCTSASGWVDAEGRRTNLRALMQANSDQRVWLLGEQHDQPAHHAWQLEVLSVLYAREPRLAIAMEMFPREAQPALDDWVAGNIDWPSLLASSRWEETWGFPAELYRPLLEFARLHRIRVVAMNVHPSAIHGVASGGLAALPENLRVELGTPAEPSIDYREELNRSFALHRSLGLGETGGSVTGGMDGEATDAGDGDGIDAPDGPAADPAALERFIAVQLTWDRGMAVAIHRTLDRDPSLAHVVAILGEAHTGRDRGVPLQLHSLGIPDAVSLQLGPPGSACPGEGVNPMRVDARFVMPEAPMAEPVGTARSSRPRLGVALGPGSGGAHILSVEPGSLAEREGLRAGDVIIELAGRRCESPAQVTEAVRRQPAGTWLPITLEREGEKRALVIHFPNET